MTFDDVGDPDGTPVVYLHGGGDSRLSRHPDDSIAARLGVRLLALDRCGPAARGRSLRSWAEEAAAMLDADRFGLIGWSAGGPHALALAAVAPERVTRVALVGSMPPPDGVGALPRDVQRLMRVVALRAARRGPRARALGQAAAAADGRPAHGRRVRARTRGVVPRRAGCGSRASSRTSAGRGTSRWPTFVRRSRCGGVRTTASARRRSAIATRASCPTPSCASSTARTRCSSPAGATSSPTRPATSPPA